MTATVPGARFVGQRVPRREDARLLAGHGRYVDDVVLPGMLHAAFVRSDVARGRIVAIDTADARAMDGVVAVLTGADLNAEVHANWVDYTGPAGDQPWFRVLAETDVRFVGEPVAVVLAESRYVAEDACALVAVEIEAEPAVGRRRRRAGRRTRRPSTPSWAPTSPARCRAPTTRSSTRSSPARPTS